MFLSGHEIEIGKSKVDFINMVKVILAKVYNVPYFKKINPYNSVSEKSKYTIAFDAESNKRLNNLYLGNLYSS